MEHTTRQNLTKARCWAGEVTDYLLLAVQDTAELLEELDEEARIARLRCMPVPTQVQVLRLFKEDNRTAYMRYMPPTLHLLAFLCFIHCSAGI